MGETVFLKQMLEFLITKALPMIGIYWLFERPIIDALFNRMTDFWQMQLNISIRTVKRFAAVGISVLVSLGLYAIYAGLGYASMPTTFETWVNLILTLGAINFTGSQVIQSKDLPYK